MHSYGTFLRKRRSSSAATLQLIASDYGSTAEGGPATASFTLSNAGLAAGADTVSTGSLSYNWLTGGSAGDYEVRATLTSGTFTTGTTGTWLALSTSRSWTVTRSSFGAKQATATFEIRAIATPGVILASASIQLAATVTA